jgi:hypothetical protein
MKAGDTVTIKTYSKGRPPKGVIVSVDGDKAVVTRKKDGVPFNETYLLVDLVLVG